MIVKRTYIIVDYLSEVFKNVLTDNSIIAQTEIIGEFKKFKIERHENHICKLDKDWNEYKRQQEPIYYVDKTPHAHLKDRLQRGTDKMQALQLLELKTKKI